MALGLGEISLGSYLNEPLKAQVDLLNVGGLHEDQIRVRLATTDDFKRMGIDRAYFLTSITFDVEIDEGGRARIVITSEDPVLEPYLDFIVEARWPSGRLLREYTVLVDPPVFDQTSPVISASARVAEVDGEPAPVKKNQQVVGGSGTRVDVRNSNLAPGEMPNRAFNSGASPSPVPGTRYMIHRDDTLWEIASKARPGGASVHQTMLDIQRLNPDAFIGGNINRIKAGFIIYLPGEGEISQQNLADAQAEVRQQNQDWREGKSSAPGYDSGPSLRISAEPEDAVSPAAGSQASTGASAAAQEDMEKAELERAELEGRLVSMEQQVETLQRIVSLKDDQIAALQGVLSEGQAAAAEAAMAEPDGAATGAPEDDADSGLSGDESVQEAEKAEVVAELKEEVAESVPEAVAAVSTEATVEKPAPVVAKPKPRPAAEVDEAGGIFSYLWYIVGALVLAIVGFVVARRRRDVYDDDTAEVAAAPDKDVFADVELSEQPLELEEPVATPPVPEVAAETARTENTRGYGQRKHDQYASDVEANDALAEADIYIAYGRYPQAIDLIKNAVTNEPANASFRLKLVQMYAETGNTAAAREQFAELEQLGDAESIATAQTALAGVGSEKSESAGEKPQSGRDAYLSDEISAEADLLADIDDPLEADFAGLEIEEADTVIDSEDELDLSADFDDAELTSDRLDEDLVIAAESNGLSTKLDLARAYMDMGDDDGARQILEEVAAEGSEELQAEARELLERIG